MNIRSLTLDAKPKPKAKFKPSSTAEKNFYRSLKKVALASGHIIDTHTDGTNIRNERGMMEELERYAARLGPWARVQSAKLLDMVARSNKRAYSQRTGNEIAAGMIAKVGEPNVGVIAAALMEEQVALIKSIPLEAGRRAQKIALEAALHGTRAEPDADTIEELKKQLGLSTEVATSRAQLIAVTETARANASINQARAIAVGAKRYIWHTTMDGAERPSHRKMNGKKVFYDEPPTLSDGTTGHAGTFPRCRCWAEPIFDD